MVEMPAATIVRGARQHCDRVDACRTVPEASVSLRLKVLNISNNSKSKDKDKDKNNSSKLYCRERKEKNQSKF